MWSSIRAVSRFVGSSVVAAFCGAWAGGAVLVAFLCVYYSDHRYLAYLIYAWPFDFCVLLVSALPALLAYLWLGHVARLLIIVAGGLSGALITLSWRVSDSAFWLMAATVSGAVAALVWTSVLISLGGVQEKDLRTCQSVVILIVVALGLGVTVTALWQRAASVPVIESSDPEIARFIRSPGTTVFRDTIAWRSSHDFLRKGAVLPDGCQFTGGIDAEHTRLAHYTVEEIAVDRTRCISLVRAGVPEN